MTSAEATQRMVKAWLDDAGMSYRDGGATGPTLTWAISMSFGGTTHVSLAQDEDHPKRLEGLSDLAIADDHQAAYAKLSKAERSVVDRRIVEVILQRTNIDFQLARNDGGVIEKIAMRAYLPLEGLTPWTLVSAVRELRNATMALCLLSQETFGDGGGIGVDRALTDPGYTSVVLQKGTLQTLGAFQIPGETLDETILRAVRE